MLEQRVAKRKTHTKSRKGCFQCKQRHTKVLVNSLFQVSSCRAIEADTPLSLPFSSCEIFRMMLVQYARGIAQMPSRPRAACPGYRYYHWRDRLMGSPQCNEERPRCANCIRLDIICTWPAITNGYLASPNPSSGGHASPLLENRLSGSPDTNRPMNVFELSIPDLRLLHHWTSKGYIALHPNLSRKSDMWQTRIIELGFEHTFLLHGILALSAVHKASFLLPGDRQDLLFQADVHISQALDTMRKNLEVPNDETAIPMFVLSSVLLTYNFGSVQEMPEDPIGSLHHCFMLLNGIKVVIGPHWDRLKDDPILSQMTDMSSNTTLQALDDLAKDDKRSEILCLMDLSELVLDTQDKSACIEAIQELHSISIRVRHVPADRDVYPFMFLWAARITNRFLELLAAHNPVACIVTVHFAALLAQAGPVWWVAKWPRYLLFATRSLLAVTPDLLVWLQWPQGVIDSVLWAATATPGSS